MYLQLINFKIKIKVHLQLNHAHHIHVVHFHVSMLQIHQVVSFANVHTTITVHKVVVNHLTHTRNHL